MKKFIAFVISVGFAVFSFWVSSYGTFKILMESDKFGKGTSLILGYVIAVIISALVGCCLYFDVFKKWTEKQ